MFRIVFHLFLIANLLICPAFCSGDCSASVCCDCHHSEQSPAKTSETKRQQPTSCRCCSQKPQSEPSENSPQNDSCPFPCQPPCETPENCPVNCLCKGAVVDRAGDSKELLNMDYFVFEFLPLVSPQQFTNPAFSSPFSFHFADSGRATRIVLMSFLC